MVTRHLDRKRCVVQRRVGGRSASLKAGTMERHGRLRALGAVVFLAAAAGAEAASIEVRVEGAPGVVLPKRFKIEVDRVAGSGLIQRSFAVGDPSEATPIKVEVGVWRVVVIADALWSREQLVTIEDAKDRRTSTVRLWPAGRIAGRFDPPPTDGTKVELTFESPPDRPPRPVARTTTRCPIVRGEWACDAPAVELDLEIAVSGYVRHHRFGVQIPIAGTLDVGVLPLRSTASIEGIVRDADGARVKSPGRIRLLSGLGERLAAPASEGGRHFETVLNHRGFYQFIDVPIGPLVLEAEAPGFAKTGAPVVVEAKTAQVRAAPIVLHRAAGLEVRLTPVLGPDGKPWMIRLLSAAAALLAVGEPRPASSQGIFQAQGLAAGPYIVGVAASTGDRWVSREVDVPGPGPVHIEVDAIAITGSVLLGSQPIRARLTFGGEFGALRVEVQSDDEGAFRGNLPRAVSAPDWEVRVVARNPAIDRTLRHVEPIDAGGELRFAIRLPSARLRGRVIDDRGVPQAGIVDIQGLEELDRIAQVGTDSAGKYDLSGLAPGKAVVLFRGRSTSSAQHRITLRDDAPSDLDLVARPYRPLRGRVIDRDGQPVANAQVQPFPNHWTRLWAPQRDGIADVGGLFEVSLPFDSREVALTVRAAGYALVSRLVPATSPAPVTLQLDRYGGTLVLDYPRIRGVDFYEDAAAYLVSGTRVELLDNSLLQAWSRANVSLGDSPDVSPRFPTLGGIGPKTLVLPQMEAGAYSLCLLTVRDVLTVEAGHPRPKQQCHDGVLAPWGILPLRVGVEN